MKKILVSILLLLSLILSSSLAHAVGSCTATKRVISENGITWFVLVEFNWTSSSDTGAVSSACTAEGISGRLEDVIFIPNSGGTAPTDQYDITVTNNYGLDVLNGVGANKPQSQSNIANNANPSNSTGGFIHLYNASLSLNVSNAGNSKGGIVRLVLR